MMTFMRKKHRELLVVFYKQFPMSVPKLRGVLFRLR